MLAAVVFHVIGNGSSFVVVVKKQYRMWMQTKGLMLTNVNKNLIFTQPRIE